MKRAFDKFDVLIVGGGAAGLSAALILGRCHRKVLVCHAVQQRNLASHSIHGLLRREGRSPAQFLAEARKELARYNIVEMRMTPVTGQSRRLGVRVCRRRRQRWECFESPSCDGPSRWASQTAGNQTFLRGFRASLSLLRRFAAPRKDRVARGILPDISQIRGRYFKGPPV